MAKKVTRKLTPPSDDSDYITLKKLKIFIKSVEEKYGTKKAHALRVELHHPEEIGQGDDAQIMMVPSNVHFMGVAKYGADKRNKLPEEYVVVLK